jgi:hypothetical protein
MNRLTNIGMKNVAPAYSTNGSTISAAPTIAMVRFSMGAASRSSSSVTGVTSASSASAAGAYAWFIRSSILLRSNRCAMAVAASTRDCASTNQRSSARRSKANASNYFSSWQDLHERTRRVVAQRRSPALRRA